MTARPRKVLLAEHQDNIAEILSYLLKAWDYEVIVAKDGISVFDIIRHEHPDVIIVDSNLPEIDGLRLSKMLKEDFLTAHIPVVILIDKREIRKRILEIEQGVDDYIVNPPDPIDLEVRLEMALRRSVHQLHANALTRLPGNRQIEKIIQEKIERRISFSVAYYDIDNFKSFNDKYGYMKGDSVIKHTAYIISTTVKRYGNSDDFVGHIGGDDFIVVTTPERDKLIATESILNFNKLTPFHYAKEDRERRHVLSKDRKGNVLNTPLMSVSIAIVNNSNYKLENMVELMEIIAEIKQYLKTLPGSNFLVNRRMPKKKGYIHPEADDGSQKDYKKGQRARYKPLGQILLDSQVLTPQELELALSKHWNTGQKIGQSIIGLGLASPGDIARALEVQLNVPHFDIKKIKKNGELEHLIGKITLDLMKGHNVIPVNKENDIVSLVMLDPRDSQTIDKIKNLTGCSIAPFFVLEKEFREVWDRVIKKADKGD
jgi:diguanylate cyclase (GGDEF)-like protein